MELIGVLRQSVADDGLHPSLAEGPTRLLVGEDILQADHFLGEAGELRLRRVDHRQPLVELAQILARGARLILKAAADTRAHRIELLGDNPGEIGLTRAENLAHAAQPARDLCMRTGKLGNLLLQIALALRRRQGFTPARACAEQKAEDQQQAHESAEPQRKI